MSEPATKKKPSMIPDWSILPGELLDVISKNLDKCFDVLHARSFPYESDDFCTLEKVPLFLFRAKTRPVPPSLYFLGGVIRDEHPSPTQCCSLKVKVHETVLNVMKILDFQILPLGHHYRVVGFDPRGCTSDYRGVAVLPLNKDGKGEEDFFLLLNYTKLLYMFRSDEMKWFGLEQFSDDTFYEVVAFRGRFYVAFVSAGLCALDPYSLEVTPLMPSPPLLQPINNLVRSGDDELFLVEKFYPFPEPTVIDFGLFTCRVSRLDEKAGKWVTVSDLGDRVFFIGHFGNFFCSAKELPNGCGVSGNSLVFTNELGNVTFAFKYSGGEEDGLPGIWRLSREYRVSILSNSPVVALRVERQSITPTLVT
ncbi:hypothetical protein Bca4012_010097 [Brassica carinata]